ncbi:MAG: hypothetical protein KDA32_03570 [Phycisphaerales bacterium]|nr:hypothetical protein [Phycisphaerales bacterium]
MALIAAAPVGGLALADCAQTGCEKGDLNGDCLIDLSDLAGFLGAFGATTGDAAYLADADFDDSGAIELSDLAGALAVFGRDCGPFIDPNEPNDATGTLTAYRPQFGTGYAPYLRTAVADGDEEDAERGPGIRINNPGDADPAGEDDLIEVTVSVSPPGAPLRLRRSANSLSVWTTRGKTPGTQVAFMSDEAALPGQTTLWVEWSAAAHGQATLSLGKPSGETLDSLRFHTFRSIVTALGGEDQVPTTPAVANSGTYVVAEALYQRGFDVLQFDEDNVSPNGSGAVYDAIVDAIQHRQVSEVAIYGYSHGGGSTYDLAERLDVNRAGIGMFEIRFTSYADSVENDSDIDVQQELRRPLSVLYHLNHYQHGTLLEDFFLDGGPVPNSNPPPTGLDVETTPWGANSTHFTVDDYVQVRSAIELDLGGVMAP